MTNDNAGYLRVYRQFRKWRLRWSSEPDKKTHSRYNDNMRLIGELTDLSLAQRFAAYLMTESITPKIEEEGGLFEVWVKEEDEQQRAAEELSRSSKRILTIRNIKE